MNEFTREELEQIAATDHVQCGDASALARMLLTAMDSEPVAWTSQRALETKNKIVAFTDDMSALDYGVANGWFDIVELYRHAQPAPVVPDKMTYQDGVLFVLNNDMSSIERGTVAMRAWNACRAAMLQGSQPVSNRDELLLDYLQGHKDGLEWAAQLAEANHPQTGDWLYDDPTELAKAIRKGPDMPFSDGNSPVIPDGWVACSERLPDETNDPDGGATGYLVLYADGKWPDGGFKVGVWNVTYLRQWWRGFITHWMPLPAAPHFREIGNSSTNNFREKSETSTNPVNLNFNGATDCWCRTCRPVTVTDMRFVVCPDCGNKRCPRANDHRNDCSGSNEPGQAGSTYPAAPQQEE
ncbi:DUF551 domain-containing protein [Citrobacter amalonaticus]|nr:DUF551 domain-containing protein [Citrobacter amalonaticus]